MLARAYLTHSTARDLPVVIISHGSLLLLFPFRKCRKLTKVEDTGFGGVVSSLHLREVDNVTTHRSSSHEATVGEVFEGLSIKVSALLLLSLPVGSSGLGAVEGTVQVNAYNLAVVRERALNHGTLGPRDTSIGNEDVQAAVEVLNALVDGLLHGGSVGDVTLVCLGWN